MVVEELPGVRARRAPRFRWLFVLTCAAWAFVATMHFWWAWLWSQLGVVSVPIDMAVWIVAIVLTISLTPVLWHRFHSFWVVTLVVGALLVGGTTSVLSPWHDALQKAWQSAECGPGDCVAPPPPAPGSSPATGG